MNKPLKIILSGGGTGGQNAGGVGRKGTNGSTNLGGGGGGARDGATAGSGLGGSGVVIIRYADSYPDLTSITGLTYAKTTYGSYKVYTFTQGTGTVTI